MIEDCRVAVVVPARDEARHSAAVVGSMPSFVDAIIVVDDGSRDDTATRAAVAGAPVEIVRHARSRGVGAALTSGYRRALERGDDIIAVMAGDGQMDPDDLAAVVAPVAAGDADYVKGNRLGHPDVGRVMPVARRLGTTLLGRLTALATGVPLGDSQCGYTAIAARALKRVDVGAMWPRYGYPNDLLGMVAAAGLRVGEVTVRPVYRDERSGLRAYHVATISWLIARAAWRRATSSL